MWYLIAAVGGLLSGIVAGFILGVNWSDQVSAYNKRTDAMMLAGMKSANHQGWLDGKNSTKETP